LDNLRKLAEHFQNKAPDANTDNSEAHAQEDDDEVPELVPGETFEATAEEGEKS